MILNEKYQQLNFMELFLSSFENNLFTLELKYYWLSGYFSMQQ